MAETDETKELKVEVQRLADEVARLNANRFIRIQNSSTRMLGYRFVGGLATGLGTVLGGTILLSLIVYALSSIDFIPVIGGWAARIAESMGAAR